MWPSPEIHLVSRGLNSGRAQPLPRIVGASFTLVIVVLMSLFGIVDGMVLAHTGFESSIPANGSTVDSPVSTVIISFTNTAAAAGDGFVALEPTGAIRTPTSVTVAQDRVFTLTFDPPLAGGTIGIRWSVAAPDAHPIEGSFSFSAPALPPPTTLTPVTTLITDGSALPLAPPIDETPAATASAAIDLDEFLSVSTDRPGETTASLGRILSLVSLALALGLLTFLATALVGVADELRRAFLTLRVLGAGLALGAAIEYVGSSRVVGVNLMNAWTSSIGLAAALRFTGGVMLAIGFAPTIRRVRRRPLALSSAVLEADRLPRQRQANDLRERTQSQDAASDQRLRWRPDQAAWPAAAATTMILASFWFDGHTVSKGPRFIHALLSSVHVAAGSVWVGGVASLAAVLWWRHATGRPGRAHELVVRFSGIATVALGTVSLAGLVMAIFVLDSFSELTGTEWGKVLLLKVAAVAVSSGFGAYNHFVLLPALEAAPDDPGVESNIRSNVLAEALVLVFVVIITASLVAAAS